MIRKGKAKTGRRSLQVGIQSRKPVCLSCASFEAEAIIDGQPVEVEYFACFDCQGVFYFMPDARPQIRHLGFSELYPERIE